MCGTQFVVNGVHGLSLRFKFILVVVLFCLAVAVNIYAAIWANKILLAEATEAFDNTFHASAILEYIREGLDAQIRVLAQVTDDDQLVKTEHAAIVYWTTVLEADLRRMDEHMQEVRDVPGLPALSTALQGHLLRMRRLTKDYSTPVLTVDQRRVLAEHDQRRAALDELMRDAASALDLARRSGAIETRSATERVNFTLLGMAVIEFGIMVVIMSLFRNWVIAPIGDIRAATEQIAAGNLDYRLGYRRRDELGNLAVEVNHMAESLSTAQRQLKTTERMAAVGEMVSVVAHNIRNPLAGIRASAQTALNVDDSDDAHRLQRRIIETVDSLEQWLKELLHLNRPLELRPEATDLDEMVSTLSQIFKPAMDRKSVDIQYEPERAGQNIEVDAQYFVQAVASILDNAIQASPAGAAVRFKAHPVNGRFRIEITDAGRGVPEELTKQVFDSYFSTKPGGTGIGLSMARKIIEAHNGTLVLLDHVEGRSGATFRIEINRSTQQQGDSHHG